VYALADHREENTMHASERRDSRFRRWLLFGLIPIGLAVTPTTRAATVQGDERQPRNTIAEAVVEVQSDDASGLGFLVDRSGLIMTSALLVREVEHAVVTFDRRGRFLAQVLTPKAPSGIAILRVNPEVVGGLQVLPFLDRKAKPPRTGEEILVAAHKTSGEGVTLLRRTILKRRAGSITHDGELTGRDVGGPVLTTTGVVVGVTSEPRGGQADPATATLFRWFPSRLEAEQERAGMLPLPPARPLAPLARGAPGGGVAGQDLAIESDRDFADYRIRSGKRNIEFLTPPVLSSLGRHAQFRTVAGEAPWQWVRLADVMEPVVVIQVVPDLRWTGGSYFRVAGRVVSYPVLVATSVLLLLVEAFAGGEPSGLLFEVHELWRPTRAAYHFKGDFREARLIRNGLEVPSIEGHRDCATTKVLMARKPTQEPRVRKIRGCWGSYTYPAEAFAPGAVLSLRLVEKGREKSPEIVPLPPALVERLWSDVGPAPAVSEPKHGR
jgi:trypsin-like peptidase